MQIEQEKNIPFSQEWLDTTREMLSRLPLADHNAVMRAINSDWTRRHMEGEKFANNPAWESYDALVAEDRAAERDAIKD